MKKSKVSALLNVLRIALKRRDLARELDNIKATGDIEKEREYIYKASKILSSDVMDAFDVKVNVINKENLPKEGPCVYIANHQSMMDIIPFMNSLNHQVGFIAKSEYTKVPFLSNWILRNRGIFIKRGDTRESLKTINEGVDYLNEGFSIVIFPEGTRSWGRNMGEFKSGSLKLATKARAPIVPVTLDKGYMFYEENKSIRTGITVDMLIHEKIETKDLTRSEIVELPEKVESIIKSGLDII